MSRAPRLRLLLLTLLVLAAAPLLLHPPAAHAQAAAHDSTDGAAAGRFERQDPQRSRLFSTSTARPIGSGEVYASSTAIFFLEAGLGLSDAVSLQVGGAVVPDAEEAAYLLAAVPKVTLLRTRTSALFDDVPLSVAVDAPTALVRDAKVIEGENWDFSTQPRVLATYGSPEAALSVGLGVPFSEDGLAARLSATYGAEVQVLEWLKLISDNRIDFGAEQRLGLISFDGERFRTATFAARSTIARFMGGTRFMWDHFALETGLGTTTGEAFDETDLAIHLRLSYRF